MRGERSRSASAGRRQGARAPAIAVEPVTDVVCNLGESPLWSAEQETLHWVDVTERRIHSLKLATGAVETHATKSMPASLALRRSGGLLVAWRTGLSIFDPATGTSTGLPAGGIDFANERFNDGKVDRRGRFFVGTMDPKLERPVAGLYRVGTDRSVARLADGIRLSNGIAWSPDDRTLYHCESRPGLVFAYDFDVDAGIISNRRLFLDLSAEPYGPDGCTVDADGCLWLAEVRAGRVGRYAPDGRRIGGIDLPAKRVTSVMFGGAGLQTLFITTMRLGLDAGELAQQPLAGRLFAAAPSVAGLPEPQFAG